MFSMSNDRRCAIGKQLSLALVGLCFAISHSCLSAQDVDFDRDIRPLLQSYCGDCHGADLAESGFRIDRRKTLLAGGDLYPQLIVPGDPESSPFLKILGGTDPDLRMPPDEPYLSASELERLSNWIRSGAVLPDSMNDEGESSKELWSLQPVLPHQPPDLPEGEGEGLVPRSDHPVDLWIDQQLRGQGLSRSPPAQPQVLARRLYLTLTGLPPTWQQLQTFLEDQRPDAYEQLVDQLLASPQLGAHWAQQWLDVVRFAESDGFETNHERPNAYHYRDWVIDSWNRDLPFDRFVKAQIAGDQMGEERATGFLVGGTYDIVKGQDDDLSKTQRENELADMVSTTATAFLGLTVGCARCHNHKFDPITQSDYYQMQSVFAGVFHGERTIDQPLSTAQKQRLELIEQKIVAAEQKFFGQARPSVSHHLNTESFPPITAKYVRFFIEQTNSAEPCIDELEVFGPHDPQLNLALANQGTRGQSSGDYAGDPKHQLLHINDGLYGNDHSWIASSSTDAWVQLEFNQPQEINSIWWSRDRRERPPAYADRLPIRYRIEVSLYGEQWQTIASSADRRDGMESDWQRRSESATDPVSPEVVAWREYQQIRQERQQLRTPQRIYAGEFRMPPTVHRLHRGEHRQPRESVRPTSLSAVSGPERFELADDASDAERRLRLSQWLTDPRNPLTFRVMANRIWQGVFGTGLVATPSDFGRMGATPTHPELLDWLANYFWENQGSRKALLRLIVTSQAFRQSSQPVEQGHRLDAQARWLWRYPPRRLAAEMIRDRLLQVSGQLDLRLGGPGYLLFEPNANYARNWEAKTMFTEADHRRMIFAMKIRMEPDAIFSAFDRPDGGQVCPSRSRSTTPLQAMQLFNSEFVIDQSTRLAQQIEKQFAEPAQQIEDAFRRILLRSPDVEELDWSITFLNEHGLAAVCRALVNTNEFLWME